MRWLRRTAFVVAAALCAPSHSAEPAIKLYCAQDVPGLLDTEMEVSAQGPHVVNVIFVRVRPSNGKMDRALRDCLNTAIKLDSSRDIRAASWYRTVERGNSGHLELLQPYGSLTGLVYRASSRTVMLQKLKPAE